MFVFNYLELCFYTNQKPNLQVYGSLLGLSHRLVVTMDMNNATRAPQTKYVGT